jgi:hypothetical protein
MRFDFSVATSIGFARARTRCRRNGAIWDLKYRDVRVRNVPTTSALGAGIPGNTPAEDRSRPRRTY